MSSPGAQAAMDDIERLNPTLRSAVGQTARQLFESGTALLAVDPNPDSQAFTSNINVVATPALGYSDSDLSSVPSLIAKEYSKLGAVLTGTSRVSLDGHQAVRATATLSLNVPSGRIQVGVTQYYLFANDFGYVITLTGSSPDLETIASTFKTSG